MTATKEKFHRGYLVVTGVILLMFPMCFILNAASIFYTPVTQDLGISRTAFGIHISISEATMALMLPTINKLFKKYDTRVTVTACMVLEGIAYFLNSRATSVWMFYVDAFFLGCCESLLIYLIIPVLVNNWFAKNTGLWIGICGAAQGVAGMLFNSVGAMVIASSGWRACYMLWAAVCIVVGVPASLLFIRFKPEDVGLKPVGYDPKSSGSGQVQALKGVAMKDAVKMSAFWVVAFCPLLMAFGCNMNMVFNDYYLGIGMTTVLAGTAASTVMFGNMIGKIIIGGIADRSLKAATICSGAGILAMLLFALVAPHVMWTAWVAAALFGVTYGACNTLGPILVKNVFGLKDFSAIWAQASRLQAISVTFATTIWAVIVDQVGYSSALWISFALFIVAVILGMKSLSDAKKVQPMWVE